MPEFEDFEEIAKVAKYANLLVSVAQGAGVPVLGLVTTIGSNFMKGREITPEDIADSREKAYASLASLKQAIAEKK